MKEAFAKAGHYLHIEPGEVWKARDSTIRLIDSLTRKWHEERYCLILSNQKLCSDPRWPIVLICPLSSSVNICAEVDLLIDQTDKNGLEKPSRLILSHIQPILKTDLETRVGEISATKWDKIVRKIFWHIDRP